LTRTLRRDPEIVMLRLVKFITGAGDRKDPSGAASRLVTSADRDENAPLANKAKHNAQHGADHMILRPLPRCTTQICLLLFADLEQTRS